MADLSGFDAHDVEPASDFEAIPPGEYVAIITDSKMKATKAGTGQYLELTFQILDGEHRNRKLWARLNLENPNAQAVQIARGELSAICRAIEVMAPRDSSELHDQPLVIKVSCKKRADTGEVTNEVKGFRKRDAHPTAAIDKETPPWLRG